MAQPMKRISVTHATARPNFINMTALLLADRTIKTARIARPVMVMTIHFYQHHLQLMYRMKQLPNAATVIQAESMLTQYQILSASSAIQQEAH
jgi:hypothetical protein